VWNGFICLKIEINGRLLGETRDETSGNSCASYEMSALQDAHCSVKLVIVLLMTTKQLDMCIGVMRHGA